MIKRMRVELNLIMGNGTIHSGITRYVTDTAGEMEEYMSYFSRAALNTHTHTHKHTHHMTFS